MTNGASITDLLKRLHAELGGTNPISDADRELLRQLSADIQSRLARRGAAGEPRQPSLTGRIGEAIARFEVSHPDLTAVLAQVNKALADMGI
jgi:hypothetical protein